MYIYITGHKNELNTKRFIDTFHKFPPGYPFQLTALCNVGFPSLPIQQRFNSIATVKYLAHDNSGYDIGGYQRAAQESNAELIVFFGTSTYFRKPNWLARVIESYEKYGLAIYGSMCNRGVRQFKVYPHVRTTGFWCPRTLFLLYPFRVIHADQRYEYEHGPYNLTQWFVNNGLKAIEVNWQKDFEQPQWNSDLTGFHRGDQSGLLFGDHMSEPPYYPVP